MVQHAFVDACRIDNGHLIDGPAKRLVGRRRLKWRLMERNEISKIQKQTNPSVAAATRTTVHIVKHTWTECMCVQTTQHVRFKRIADAALKGCGRCGGGGRMNVGTLVTAAKVSHIELQLRCHHVHITRACHLQRCCSKQQKQTSSEQWATYHFRTHWRRCAARMNRCTIGRRFASSS